jgi:GDP-L-fucose synthase
MLLCANKPDVIIDAAAKVGGILANNNFPTNFDGKHANTNNLLDAASPRGRKNLYF